MGDDGMVGLGRLLVPVSAFCVLFYLVCYTYTCIHRAQAKAAEALAAGRKGEEGEKALHDGDGDDGDDGDGSREGSEEAATDQEEEEANNK